MLFDIRIMQEISKGEVGNDKWQGMANYNIYFKNNFNRLVMSIAQINFLYWQNVHIWHLIKVNYKRSLWFVSSWSKTKIFINYNNKIYTANAKIYVSFSSYSGDQSKASPLIFRRIDINYFVIIKEYIVMNTGM